LFIPFPLPIELIGSGNELNMYLNPRVYGSIPTEGKNSTSEGGGEGRELAVPGAPKARAVTPNNMLKGIKILTTYINYSITK
jgi:hypothetical protein